MIPAYMHLTDMDGHPVTIFLQGIVMIAPGSNHSGAYIQLTLGGISTQETYEDVMRQIEGTTRDVAQRQLGDWPRYWPRPWEKK